ncbi:MAG: aminotransferase class V-fold PLP-dependent enzyme [Cryobacterium sp.]|nr:aminotransferase class V-fold PLP-dependent enzyme [Cryobacterium sp.]
MTFDAQTIRSSFPALATGTAFVDGPGGTQTPLEVGAAILATLTGPLSIRGTGSPPVAEIARLVHSVGALLYVDGVHFTPHASVDLAELGADFFVCSAYKFFGPHCGVLAAPAGASRRERLVLSAQALAQHEETLRDELEAGLAELPGAQLHSRAAVRTPTVLVTFAGHDAAEASRYLAAQGILAPAGSFYALEASRHLGLGADGGLRIGLAPYNTRGEVAQLLAVLRDFLRA